MFKPFCLNKSSYRSYQIKPPQYIEKIFLEKNIYLRSYVFKELPILNYYFTFYFTDNSMYLKDFLSHGIIIDKSIKPPYGIRCDVSHAAKGRLMFSRRYVIIKAICYYLIPTVFEHLL